MNKKIKTYNLSVKLIEAIKDIAFDMSAKGDFKIYESGVAELALKAFADKYNSKKK